MDIQKKLAFGLDLGIASCGWAVIEEDDKGGGRILALGSRTFDVPETPKDRTPTNQLRRQHRGLRRVLRRRRHRMNTIRRLFAKSGLTENHDKDALKIVGLDPWRLRAEGLERRLTGPEFAVALGHIAKHRGFKSNSKRGRGNNAPDENSKMYSAFADEAKRMMEGGYRTIGEMFAKDPEYAGRKRNRDGDYTRSILRAEQEQEVKLLFASQRRMGNPLASESLEWGFIDEAFFQRPLADSEDKVGRCPFEPEEKRAAKRSYSFELFRFLSRLAALRIRSGRDERALTAEEIVLAAANFGAHKGMNYKQLRKLLALNDDESFDGSAKDDEGSRDVVARSGAASPGTYALRKVLGEAGWRSLIATPGKLDRIAFALTFREDVGSIRKGLEEIELEPLLMDALMKGVDEGAFGDFKGAGHISAKACRAIVPHLMRGLVYSDACKAAGYDHSKRLETDLNDVRNPIARKALTEALKQVRAIVREYGQPSRIHVELARDVGKSKEEREEIRSGIEKRNKEKDRLRQQFKEDIGVEPSGAEDLLRYELWKEQNCRSLYSDDPIPVKALVSSDRTVEVDHILPWSLSGDDSFLNKTLCFARENQLKKGRTPYDWLRDDEKAWAQFVERIETNKALKRKKRNNYLLKDASVLEEKFRSRNLNDTRYATRLLLNALKTAYPNTDVDARPGALTDRLRRGWGVQRLKKDSSGARVDDDRHHALDALIVAATNRSALQRLTHAFQESERLGLPRDFSRLDPPWPGFFEETREKLAQVFVSRAVRGRARGEAHAATIRQIAERDGKPVVFERKNIDALTVKDLENVKDPERNAKIIEALRAWIDAGKPKSEPPLSPKGDPIRKVRLQTNKKVDVPIHRGAAKPGTAERGEMVRVDVFRKANKKGRLEYFLVPIYPHQVADAARWPEPPNKAVQAATDEADWPVVDGSFEYLFALYPMSYVEMVTAKGEIIEGYFRGLDRSGGQLILSAHFSKSATSPKTGSRTLRSLRKFTVDRLGRRFEIEREIRTWRGVACT